MVSSSMFPLSPQMIQGLLEAECVKLKDPLYPGGGLNPPFGPVVSQQAHQKDRFAYKKLLKSVWQNLILDQLDQL